MRIVAGRHGGRKLVAPKTDATRPTADRVREALFSILGDLVEGAHVLDLYSGSGALALEAISRGASMATCVESSARARAAILENVRTLGELDRVTLVPISVERALEKLEGPFDLVLADPPWADVEKVSPAIFRAMPRLLAEDGTLVVEHARREPITPPEPWRCDDVRTYGDTALSFFHRPRRAGA
ncbi:MAG: 16S rRNA (guanine(966)-N(2))-methyltransferase RsmD [Deltaproteobacteria bacterium]|nr:16S rRNA (guanine(966)-N(2))-methyltransferase RsmD [Deltaproteobacteria bacterium]